MHCEHPQKMLGKGPGRYRFICYGCDQIVTAREVGLNPRAMRANPRALGTNPKARGINPIALGINPNALKARRKWKLSAAKRRLIRWLLAAD